MPEYSRLWPLGWWPGHRVAPRPALRRWLLYQPEGRRRTTWTRGRPRQARAGGLCEILRPVLGSEEDYDDSRFLSRPRLVTFRRCPLVARMAATRDKSPTIPRVNLKGAQRPPSVQEFTRHMSVDLSRVRCGCYIFMGGLSRNARPVSVKSARSYYHQGPGDGVGAGGGV